MFRVQTRDLKQHPRAAKIAPPLHREDAHRILARSHALGTPAIAPRGMAPFAQVSPQEQKLMRLQNAHGNQAVLRMLDRSRPATQPKLTVNEPGDVYEQEADRVADRVMRMPQPELSIAPAPAQLSRKCAACEAEEETQGLQMKPESTPDSAGREAPPIVHDVLRSPGQPLDAETRAFFEPRFGYDFSGVRVHISAQAAQSARAVGALAYTVGSDVTFAADHFAPSTRAGAQLLAHELTHVVQQRAAPEQLSPMESVTVTEPTLQRACSGGEGACSAGRWHVGYDGCTMRAWLAGFLGINKDNPAGGKDTQFGLCRPSHKGGRACDRHDECYQTCRLGTGKDFCDIQFLIDMLAICNASSESTRVKTECVFWATAYYKGVVELGGFAFAQRQYEVCKCALWPSD